MAAFLEKEDLASHQYIENIDEITRDDDDIVTSAINAAVSKAKSYLSRYNRTKLFDPAASGFIQDHNLKSLVKDMACFNLLTLSNANINYEIFDNLNTLAINWLKDVQKGNADPEGWPYAEDDEDSDFTEGQETSFYTNTKRTNHY